MALNIFFLLEESDDEDCECALTTTVGRTVSWKEGAEFLPSLPTVPDTSDSEPDSRANWTPCDYFN